MSLCWVCALLGGKWEQHAIVSLLAQPFPQPPVNPQQVLSAGRCPSLASPASSPWTPLTVPGLWPLPLLISQFPQYILSCSAHFLGVLEVCLAASSLKCFGSSLTRP